MNQVNITYLGHACFLLEAERYRIVIDPYHHGMVPGLPDLQVEAEAVYCSHQHDDHNFVAAVSLRETDAAAPYTLKELVVPHDDAEGAKRGMNTIRVFDFGGLRVAHMGDLGRTLTEKEAGALGNVDCMLIPVGGFYTIDAAAAKTVTEQVKPRVIVPMHFRTEKTGFPVIAGLEDFTKLFPTVCHGANTFTLTKDTPKGILVLHYKDEGDKKDEGL